MELTLLEIALTIILMFAIILIIAASYELYIEYHLMKNYGPKTRLV